MSEKPQEYYLLVTELSMNADQWGYLLNIIDISATIFGIWYALRVYQIQRNDSAKDAYDFFMSNLKDLNKAINNTIDNLKEFSDSLKEEHFKAPLISHSLNDRFIEKVNITDLSRYYKTKLKNKEEYYRILLKDANFFGDYNNFYSSKIEYLQNFFMTKESEYLKWQLLRTYNHSNTGDLDEFTENYSIWIINMITDDEVFDYNEEKKTLSVINRSLLIERHIKLIAYNSYKYVLENHQTANEVNRIATQVISAYIDSEEFKSKLENSLKTDIEKLKKIQTNLSNLI